MRYYEFAKHKNDNSEIEFTYCTEEKLLQYTKSFNPEVIQEIPKEQYYKKSRDNITLDINSIIKDN